MGQIGCPSLDQLGPDFLWQRRLAAQPVTSPSERSRAAAGAAQTLPAAMGRSRRRWRVAHAMPGAPARAWRSSRKPIRVRLTRLNSTPLAKAGA